MILPFSAVVFDLDGTLIDSAPDLARAVNALLGEAGLAPLRLDEVRRMIGDGATVLVEKAMAARGRPLAPDATAAAVARFLEHYTDPDGPTLTTVYDGVPETLAFLREAGVARAVCTNKPQVATDMVLEECGLSGLIDAAVGGDAVARRKPHGDHVRAALAAIGADAGGVAAPTAAMVGDGENDLAAGRAAGLPVVLVSWGYAKAPPATLGADRLIDRFADLPEALAALARSFRR